LKEEVAYIEIELFVTAKREEDLNEKIDATFLRRFIVLRSE